jgi:hypothetical protein
LAIPKDDEDKAAVDDAVDVLRAILENGPMPAKDVQEEARRARVTGRTLDRAKSVLGVKSKKLSFAGNGAWQWFLPGHCP